jgi:hypothetical protein
MKERKPLCCVGCKHSKTSLQEDAGAFFNDKFYFYAIFCEVCAVVRNGNAAGRLYKNTEK